MKNVLAIVFKILVIALRIKAVQLLLNVAVLAPLGLGYLPLVSVAGLMAAIVLTQSTAFLSAQMDARSALAQLITNPVRLVESEAAPAWRKSVSAYLVLGAEAGFFALVCVVFG